MQEKSLVGRQHKSQKIFTGHLMKWRNVADINDYGENLNCENLHRFSTFSLTNDSGNVLCEHYMTYNHC